MAAPLTRRAFLAATTGAGLLGRAPVFGQLWPIGVLGPSTEFRRQPAYEKLRPLVHAGSDEFDCEVRADALARALSERLEEGRPPRIAPGFEGRSPEPSGWDELSPAAKVARFNPDDRDFEGGWKRWQRSHGAAAVFQLRFFPLEDDLVRYEIGPTDSQRTVGMWRVEVDDEGQLTRFEPIEETTFVRSVERRLDHLQLLDPESPEYRQFERGTPDWRRRIDLTSGIDVYGQNGVAVGDFNNDGFDEIYVCQPGGLPNRLLRRDEDGLYRDVSAAAGVDLLDHTSCALFADFRNVGLQDLVVLTGSQPLYFENNGAGGFALREGAFRFREAPKGAFTGMAAADYDGDGFLDLYLCTYIYFQSEDQYSYPAPYHDARNGPPNFLFRNRLHENGVFEDVTSAVGLDVNNDRYSFAPAWCDYDFDGRPELYVANDFGRNNLYKFDGVRFRDVAAETGVEDLGPGMSATWFDSESSGRPDLYVTNMWTAAGRRVTHDPAFSLTAEKGLVEEYRRHTKGNSLYRNRGDGTFEETGEAEMGRWAWAGEGFDLDADGAHEIYVAAGMISENPTEDLMSFFWRQVVAHSSADGSRSVGYEEGWNGINQFIREGYSWNGHEPNVVHERHGGQWVDASPPFLKERMTDSRAFAVSDLSGDGRLDLLIKGRGDFQLTRWKSRSRANVLVLELTGVQSNRDAIGAWVTAESANGKTSYLVSAGSGYLCQHTKRVHLGLGEAQVAERVTIRWPSGAVEELDDLEASRRYRVTEGEGVTDSSALAPESGRTPGVVPEWTFYAPLPPPPWLIEPVPLPETIPGPGLLVLADQEVEAPLGAGHVEVIRLDESPEDRGAWYEIFQRYLFDYRGPLKLPAAFLIDADSRAHRVYHDVPSAEMLRADLTAMRQQDRMTLALPFPGWYAGGTPRRSYFRHGAAFYQAGYPEQALPYLDEVLARDPQNFKAQQAVGQIHLDAERIEAARPHIEEAVRLKADSPEAWNNYGGLAMLEQDYALASDRFHKALELAPDSTYALANAAQAANRLGKTAGAERLFRRALELEPEDSDSTNQLGLLLAKQERFDEAKRHFQRAIELDRENVSAVNNLAVLYLRLNQPSEAIAALRFGVRVAPQSEETYMNLARVYVQTGDREQARVVLGQLLEAVPTSSLGRRALAELNRP